MIRFAVLSMPRTGSTMVVERLGSHPDVICYLALFSRREFFAKDHDQTENLRANLDGWDSWDDRQERYTEFIQDMMRATLPCKAVGLKQHLSGPRNVSEALIADPEIRIIYLTRWNHLATYSSAQIAIQKGWGNQRTSEYREQPRIQFDVDQFETHIRVRDRQDTLWTPLIRAAGGLEISYAHARTRAGADDLWAYIGVDSALGGDTTLVKSNSDNLLERFENPVAVEDWLHAHDRKEWLSPEH